MAESELVNIHYCNDRGYHVYKEIWDASIGEMLVCRKEEGNVHDPYCVGVVNERNVTVGHVPREISALCSLFLEHQGTISCEVTGNRMYSKDLPQGGLEIPCKLCFRGTAKYVDKVKALLADLPQEQMEKPKENQISKCKTPETVLVVSSDTEDCPGEPLSSTIWQQVDGHHLFYSDRDILQEGRRLNDRHINYAQKLLKLQFPCIEGLNLTLYQHKKQEKIKEGLQVIHCKERDHWVLASNLACDSNEVVVYDSLFESVDQETEDVLINLFEHDGHLKVSMGKMQKQKGSNDCGLFAIAMCTSIVFDVQMYLFKQEKM
jgi:hypothetical protein